MKFLLLLSLSIMSLYAAQLDWTSDYKQALIDAKKEHKLVYIFISSDSCRWCRKFENTTLKDTKILQRLYSEFIPVHLSRDRNIIPKQFETAPVPRHYFSDANGKILYSSLGHRGTVCFDAFMDNAEDKIQVSQ